jgi:uroporphyrinogen-III synthase
VVDALVARGTQVEAVAVYRTVADPEAGARLGRALQSGVDYVSFTSPSTVRAFAAAGRTLPRPPRLKVACIGPTTAAEAEEHGLHPDVIAEPHTAAGLAAAIARDAAADRR